MPGESSDIFKTIGGPGQGLFKDRGSRFIGLAYPAATAEEALAIIEEVRKKFHDARHHCFAWALGPEREEYRINDDGEPSGSAGRPIFGQILSLDVTNVVVIVVRYFGGTKLGVRGLINAYKAAAREALVNAGVVERTVTARFEVLFNYNQMNDIMRMIDHSGARISAREFGENCRVQVEVPLSKFQQLVAGIDKLRVLQISTLEG